MIFPKNDSRFCLVPFAGGDAALPSLSAIERAFWGVLGAEDIGGVSMPVAVVAERAWPLTPFAGVVGADGVGVLSALGTSEAGLGGGVDGRSSAGLDSGAGAATSGSVGFDAASGIGSGAGAETGARIGFSADGAATSTAGVGAGFSACLTFSTGAGSCVEDPGTDGSSGYSL